MTGVSRTAALVAALRALATARPERVCDDPWAAALAGPEGMADAEVFLRAFPFAELWLALRTAFLDEHLVKLLDQGFRQVVLLGSGLDTRAARLGRTGVRFFEVDRGDSHAERARRVAGLPKWPAAPATAIGCDFERDDFVERLVASGLDPAVPAVVVWEGVTYYLEEEAVRTTLRNVATRLHSRSILLFDHFSKKFVDAAARNRKDDAAASFVEDLGERFVFGTNDPLPMLHEAGFRHVRSVSFDELALTYTGTYDRAREFRFQRIVTTSCTRPLTR